MRLLSALWALFGGSEFARWFGVGVAGLNAFGQLMFVPAYPVWAIAMTPGTAALSLTRATIPGPPAGSSAVRAGRARSGSAPADEALLDDRRHEQAVTREHRSSRQPSSAG